MSTRSERSRLDQLLLAYTRFAARKPLRVLAVALVVLCVSWALATRLKIRGDFVRLLPSESPTAQRFLSTLERKGGGASTLIVLVDSPSPEKNRAFIDALEKRLRNFPEGTFESLQHGPGAERTFIDEHRWLYASYRDLLLIECELRAERERQSPFGLGLDDPCSVQVDEALANNKLRHDEPQLAEELGGEKHKAKPAPDSLADMWQQLETARRQWDKYPTGYFRDPEGHTYALVLRITSTGMGDFSTDSLLASIEQEVATLKPQRFHAQARVGFTGDIPNAVAERQALMEDIAAVSLAAIALILGSILFYFRSALALVHIGLAVGTACGVAFAAAALAYGHLNAATSFLGSIIAGNGINDAIIYLARYRERRAAGDDIETALLDAASNTRRGTWLASVAASGAYGALMITSFRGFSEFGLIGLVGMVTAWFATFGFCPASIALLDRWQAKRKQRGVSRPFTPLLMGGIATLAMRYSGPLLVGVAVFAVVAAWPIRGYLADPWEYNFSKLRSRSSSESGAGHFSKRADAIFQRRGSPVLLLADTPEQALQVKQAVFAADQRVTGGKLVERVSTVHDRLGGPPELVQAKLDTLGDIRGTIDELLPKLSGADRERARQWRPPDNLKAPSPDALPPLLKAEFSERDGKVGTPVYVYFDRKLSRSQGENLLRMSDVLAAVSVKQGDVVPSAGRASVFAEMIRSMERDGPRATLAAFLVVVLVAALATRAWLPLLAVLGSLLLGVLFTVGGAAWFDVRLNFLNFVALPLTFGIGVEYAINLYDRIRIHGGDIAEGIRSAGGAVGLCSLTTILGYGSLLFADNQALQSFGRYAVLGEISCMITALLIMPATLGRFRRAPKAS